MTKIRLDKSKYLGAVELNKSLDVQMQRTSRKLPYINFRESLNLDSVYLDERLNCDNYRLITTISPYCTNVLFNPLTEVYDNKNEKVINWLTNKEYLQANKKNYYEAFVWNTNNSLDPNYDIYYGGDIFTNHIMRNSSFKSFNFKDGKPKEFEDDELQKTGMTSFHCNRKGDKIINESKEKYKDQLYEYGDIIPFELTSDEKINGLYNIMDYELRDIDGWYGFYNRSNIKTNANYKDSTDVSEIIDVSKIIGNKQSGDFLTLYPTKDLFLFNPVYNERLNRIEQNWEICLTYPYANYYDGDEGLIGSKEWNGIRVMGISTDVKLPNGEYGYEITTCLPHNLNLGEKFILTYRNSENKVIDAFKENGKYLSVSKLGDSKGNKNEYVVLVNKNVFEAAIQPEKDFEETNFRLVKLRKSIESEYYFRIFRRLPNFKTLNEELTYDILKDEKSYKAFLNDISTEFSKENYPLGFSQTVYNDANTQVTFTDSITPYHLVDNLGRPITEFYTTIVKTNNGKDEWYNEEKEVKDSSNIECSHCFSNVTMGVKGCEVNFKSEYRMDDDERNEYDIRCIDGGNGIKFSVDDLKDIDIVTIKDDYFLGDVVEFNFDTLVEYKVSDVYHRFNTEQRELIGNENNVECHYENLNTDGFVEPNETINIGGTTKEGYYYQPHYRIQIKEFGESFEGEHIKLDLFSVSPYDRKGSEDDENVNQYNHDCYLFRSLKKVNLQAGDIIRVKYCVVNSEETTPTIKYFRGNVLTVVNRNCFVVDFKCGYFSDEKCITWNTPTVDELNELKELLKTYTNKSRIINFYADNMAIPWYAIKHPQKEEKYVWREIIKIGDSRTNLGSDCVFANGHIYLNQRIPFYLRRQDPFGYYGKLSTTVFGIGGRKKPEPTTKVTPTKHIIC